ncbi:MAG: tRNA (adenosine(37)-N6)-threonylcarbamoyltransferase complex dimerization subunit type 1 TsaB [Rhizobiaceae bacterium]
MLLLAIDTSAHLCSACLYDCDAQSVLSKDVQNIGRGHAEILMNQITFCLDQADVGFKDVGRIGVVNGPGSFTGVRVGLAVARGLALGLDKDAVGISSLDACEAAAFEKADPGVLLTLLDARRNQAYCKHRMHREPFIKSYDELAADFPDDVQGLCGSGSIIIKQKCDLEIPVIHELSAPPIESVARLSAEAKHDGKPPEPVYLRTADAKPQSGFALKMA